MYYDTFPISESIMHFKWFRLFFVNYHPKKLPKKPKKKKNRVPLRLPPDFLSPTPRLDLLWRRAVSFVLGVARRWASLGSTEVTNNGVTFKTSNLGWRNFIRTGLWIMSGRERAWTRLISRYNKPSRCLNLKKCVHFSLKFLIVQTISTMLS